MQLPEDGRLAVPRKTRLYAGKRYQLSSRATDVRGDDVQSRAVRRCTYLPLVYRPTFSVLQPNSEPDALRGERVCREPEVCG